MEPQTLVDDTVAEITYPDFPGERPLVCLNTRLRAERARKREALIEVTEAILLHIQQIVRRKRSRLRGAVAIARVRAHGFLCLLALYVQWPLRRKLASLLLKEEQPDQAREHGTSPVQKAEVSDNAKRKAASKRTEDGLAVSSLDTLLNHLATLTLNEVVMPAQPNRPLILLAEATPLQ